MSSYDLAFKYLINNERGLEENENDPGGITNYGISLRFLQSIDESSLKKYGIYDHPVNANTIRNLSDKQIYLIYEGEFWNHASFSEIDDQEICNYIFDSAVNMGIAPAIKCVQRSLWASFGKKDIIADDGILGHNTLSLINSSNIQLSCIRSERAGEYRLIASIKTNEKEFLEGWLKRAYTKSLQVGERATTLANIIRTGEL